MIEERLVVRMNNEEKEILRNVANKNCFVTNNIKVKPSVDHCDVKTVKFKLKEVIKHFDDLEEEAIDGYTLSAYN